MRNFNTSDVVTQSVNITVEDSEAEPEAEDEPEPESESQFSIDRFSIEAQSASKSGNVF